MSYSLDRDCTAELLSEISLPPDICFHLFFSHLPIFIHFSRSRFAFNCLSVILGTGCILIAVAVWVGHRKANEVLMNDYGLVFIFFVFLIETHGWLL